MALDLDKDFQIFKERAKKDKEKAEQQQKAEQEAQKGSAPVQPVEQKPIPTNQPVAEAAKPQKQPAEIPRPEETPYVPAWKPESEDSNIRNRPAAAMSQPRGEEAANMMGVKSKPITRSEKKERSSATGKYCVWHPWRQAYALCGFCHRPFCFEDLVEEVGSYYCLEDIDRMAQGQVAPGSGGSVKSALGIASGAIFMLPLVLFIYFEGANLAYVVQAVQYAQKVGLLAFIQSGNYDYLFSVSAVALTSLSLLTGIIIFLRSKRAGGVGLLVGFIMAGLFIYDYTKSSSIYSLSVAVIALVAMGLLVASSPSSKEVAVKMARERGYGDAPIDWPNVGRF